MTKEQDIYQLIQPETIHKNVVSIDSAKEVPKLTEHIVEEMRHFSWEATYALDNFLLALFMEWGPQGAVFVKRIKNDKRTILDIHILWNPAASVTDEETTENTQKLTVQHQKLRDLIFLPIDSVLHFIAPTKYKTVEQLQAAIPATLPENQKTRVIGSVNALHKSILILFKKQTA